MIHRKRDALQMSTIAIVLHHTYDAYLRSANPMKAYEWIDRLKVEKHIPSDYAVAKTLGLSQSSIITMRARKSTFDEDTAVKVATALGLNPVGIIIDQASERVKSPSVRAILAREVDRLCILCKVTGRYERHSTPRNVCKGYALV